MTMKPVRPAKRLVQAGAQCSVEGMAYGQCMLTKYSTMTHNACEQEFAKFKKCVDQKLKK